MDTGESERVSKARVCLCVRTVYCQFNSDTWSLLRSYAAGCAPHWPRGAAAHPPLAKYSSTYYLVWCSPLSPIVERLRRHAQLGRCCRSVAVDAFTCDTGHTAAVCPVSRHDD